MRETAGTGWPTAVYSIVRNVDSNRTSSLSFNGDGSITLANQNKFATTLDISGNWRPTADNVSNLGASSDRWKTVYAVTGTINTSDACEKKLRALTDPEKRVARRLGALIQVFQWRDAIEVKGVDSARLHVGVTAQDVAEAFRAEGLDAARYGVWCEDDVFNDVVTEVNESIEVPVMETAIAKQKRIKVVDGCAVLHWDSVSEVRPKTISLPVFYADGKAVMVARPASAGGPYQMMHEHPVTESRQVTREVKERRLAGKRLGLRYNQLFAWVLAGLGAVERDS